MLKLLYMLVFATFVFFITPSEGSSYSTAWATNTAVFGYPHLLPTVPTHVCGPHEVYSTCINSGCQPRTCAELDRPIAFCPKFEKTHCIRGCTCVPGYVRDENDVCIPKNNCYPICGKNEIYSTCSNNGCGPKTCDQQGYKIGCVKMDQKYCRGGCICKDGYLKDQNGECIPKSMCPECGGDPNAIGCDNEDTCKCRDGFIYDETIGKCVVPEESKCIKPHEIYDSCAPNCPPQTCESIGKQHNCLQQPLVCRGACRCEPGYYRDKNGDCIHEKHCQPQCPVGEIYEKCPDNLCTPRTCSQLGFPMQCPASIEASGSKCLGKPRCICANGNVRDDNGKCIPKHQCPSCGGDPNATTGCGVNCGKKCSDCQDKNPVCPLPCNVNGCDCKKGYVYDDNLNICVLPSQCTQSCGVNEVYDTCANGGCRKWKCSQAALCIDPIKCEGGCVCRENYSRADNGTCIPENQCESQCPVGEIYEKCPDNSCTPQTCSQLGFPMQCPASIEASGSKCLGKPRCICANGNVRDDNGKCIPKHQCPSCGGDCNATSGCGVNCGKKCSDYKEKNPICLLICNVNGCDCKKGYVYDDNLNKCVLPSQCTPSCGVNEMYTTCANGGCRKWKCSQPTLCKDPIKCEGGCVCRDKYTRADNGTCIPENQCKPQCPVGEIYEKCPDNLCTPQTCSQLGFPMQCSASLEASGSKCLGKPRCICTNGNVRDDNGKCIPKHQCPSCGGDPNATSGCGVNCGKKCSDYKDKNPFCPFICNVNGCDCKKGYVYDDNLNKCVLPSQCTPSCGINEHYDTCANGGCRKWKCSQPTLCKDPIKCEGGCVCRDKYVRADNGTCILENQCTPTCGLNEVYDTCANGGCRRWNCSQSEVCKYPIRCEAGCSCQDGYSRNKNGICIPEKQCPGLCSKPHEYYDDCPQICLPQTCENIEKLHICPVKLKTSKCKGSCMCEKGYYRNLIGECISEEDCKKCRGPHEYFSCGGVCDNVCATLHKYNQTTCPFINITCNRKCYCERGYARDQNNICIPIHKCPERQCGPNERYEECPDSLCSPQKCSQLGFPIDCKTSTSIAIPHSVSPEKPGCVCDNGYVRDKSGKCIPPEKCPSCGGDPNAVTGCGNHCGRKCSDYKDKNTVCPLYCVLNSCMCRDGFVYDDNLKKCVLPEDCTPTCGINEVYDTCANGGCHRWNCSKSILCIDPIICKAGCSCKKGFSRVTNGTCIPEDKCPEPQCPVGEIYEKCPDNLCEPLTCSQLGFPIQCPASIEASGSKCLGKPRCICAHDNVRDDNGKCIPKHQCPSCGGDPNATSGCGVNCGKKCSNYKDKNTVCPLSCNVNGCDCKKGYVYDDNSNNCVLPSECTPTCGLNEVYDTCANGGCRRWNCSQSEVCKYPIRCEAGCSCQDGYSRNENGICIPEKQCPERQCGPNERYEECPDSLCSPQKCSQLGFPIDCKTSTSIAIPHSVSPEKPGCVCDNGYVRDKSGKCIPPEKCPSCGGDPNAVTGCGNHCGRRCSDYKDKNTVCPLYCVLNSCMCRDGFVYDDNLKKCVLPQDCTPTCGINEVYDTCANGGCRRWNCSKSILCIDPVKCKVGCSCKKGFSRVTNGTCIPEDKCPEPQCPVGEIYEKCPDNLCEPLTCSQLGFPIQCPASIEASGSKCLGKPRCICAHGNVRDDNGKCIPKHQCPSCGGDPNATSGCGVNCGKKCSNYKDKNTVCPLSCNVNGCDCKKGYVYDDNSNNCVLPSECTPTCGLNEVYDTCANGGCRRWNCSQSEVCKYPIRCEAGCSCQDGYSRNENGICIPEKQCPGLCSKPHEYYDDCPQICLPQTCENIEKLHICPVKLKTSKCKGRCMCEKGYYRNLIGECISEEDCKKCRGPHEYFSCGGVCDNVCATLHEYNQTTCPFINIICNRKCYCERGYARDKNNICIPIHKCPERQCGSNERYEECPDSLCSPQKCSQLGFPIDCKTSTSLATSNSSCTGKPGCVCDNDYVRDKFGKCIPPEKCPSCGGDPNAVKGCGVNCGRLCSNYDNGPVPCIKICKVNSCDCKHGFVLDENTKKCVNPKDCTPTCGKNEVYSECINGGCERKNCSQLGKPVPCVKINTEECVKGCLCKEKYLRARNGTCIPEKQCKKRCTKPHEYYERCARSCPPQTCASIGRRYNCPLQRKLCRGACRCEKGYYRNIIGECIAAKDCKKCTGPHEYFSCGKECDNVCATLHKQNQTHCPFINKTCKRKCYCEKGYARNDKNICVPIKQCQEPVCGKNEKYEDNPSILCRPLKCSDLVRPLNDTSVVDLNHNYKPACICKEGYLRDDHGLCVPKSQCEPVCGKNEKYEDNPSILCRPLKCSDLDRPLNDTSVVDLNHNYKPACICKEGYLRDDHGLCVPKSQCPPCD